MGDHKCALKLQKDEDDEYINENLQMFEQLGSILLKHKKVGDRIEKGDLWDARTIL